MTTSYKEITKGTPMYEQVEAKAKGQEREVVKVRETEDPNVLVCWLKNDKEQIVTLYGIEMDGFFRGKYYPNFLLESMDSVEKVYLED